MPRIDFSALPDDARVWVFAAADPVRGEGAGALLARVDRFLDGWAAHGVPLRCARDWRDDRFLAVGVDQSLEGASGCSIDGMFRTLQGLESTLGTTLLGGGRVYWRDADGMVQVSDRDGFAGRVAGDATRPVFDTTVTTAADWRVRFERPLAESWHARLVG
jgi:hypothetical protein